MSGADEPTAAVGANHNTLCLLRPPEERRPSVVYEEDIPVNLRRASVTMTLRITDEDDAEGADDEEDDTVRVDPRRRGRSASWLGRLSGRSVQIRCCRAAWLQVQSYFLLVISWKFISSALREREFA